MKGGGGGNDDEVEEKEKQEKDGGGGADGGGRRQSSIDRERERWERGRKNGRSLIFCFNTDKLHTKFTIKG